MTDKSVVILTSEEYWELRARAADVECAELKLALQLREAKETAVKVLDRVIAKYGLDASAAWTLDETQKALVPVTPQTPPK